MHAAQNSDIAAAETPHQQRNSIAPIISTGSKGAMLSRQVATSLTCDIRMLEVHVAVGFRPDKCTASNHLLQAADV